MENSESYFNTHHENHLGYSVRDVKYFVQCLPGLGKSQYVSKYRSEAHTADLPPVVDADDIRREFRLAGMDKNEIRQNLTTYLENEPMMMMLDSKWLTDYSISYSNWFVVIVLTDTVDDYIERVEMYRPDLLDTFDEQTLRNWWSDYSKSATSYYERMQIKTVTIYLSRDEWLADRLHQLIFPNNEG